MTFPTGYAKIALAMSTALRPTGQVARPEPEQGTTAGSTALGQRSVPLWLAGGSGLALAIGVALRLWTSSALWLDEAQTLAIARMPLDRMTSGLRQDGSPPLYYLLLHGWVALFGTSTFALRLLPGLLGVLALPLAWLAGLRTGGRKVAWAALLLVASSPFAIWYSTDLRMYSLLVLEAFGGGILLASAWRRPRPVTLVGLAATTAALLYTHYWSFFLVGATALTMVAGLWRDDLRLRCIRILAALAAGTAAFLPWLGDFFFQLHHTGTPWTAPAGLSVLPDTLQQFAGGPTNQGTALEAILLALGALGLFGMAKDPFTVEVDIRGRQGPRWLAAVSLGTLLLAVAGSKVAGSGFQDRYSSVAFPSVIVLAACGSGALASPLIRRGILSVAVALGLLAALPNIHAQRTQAVQVAAYLNQHAQRGDVVAYCPDQLGPDAVRLVRAPVTQVGFPRGTKPTMVDWVDYRRVLAHASPEAFARRLLSMAGPDHTVWLVWQDGYRGFGLDCRRMASDLVSARPLHYRPVSPDYARYGEASHLSEFPPQAGLRHLASADLTRATPLLGH